MRTRLAASAHRSPQQRLMQRQSWGKREASKKLVSVGGYTFTPPCAGFSLSGALGHIAKRPFIDSYRTHGRILVLY